MILATEAAGRALAAILGFVGTRILLPEVVPVPTSISLGVVTVALAITIWASLRADEVDERVPADTRERP